MHLEFIGYNALKVWLGTPQQLRVSIPVKQEGYTSHAVEAGRVFLSKSDLTPVAEKRQCGVQSSMHRPP